MKLRMLDDSDSDYNPQTFGRKVNRPKAKGVRFNAETKIRMIQLYERHPCLWDTKHQDYWNRIERSKAEKEIAALLKYPVGLISARWQALRNDFRTERNKVLKRRDTNKPYEPKWPFYAFLKFLENHSNRPYKVSKRRLTPDVELINDGANDELVDDGSIVQVTPISIHSRRLVAATKTTQVASTTTAAVTRRNHIRTFANASTYAHEKDLHLSDRGIVSQCLGIIEKLATKIRPAEQDHGVRVFGELVKYQLKQFKSEACREKCEREIQQVLMEWQDKDDASQLQLQQGWQMDEEHDLSADDTPVDDINDAIGANVDRLDE